MRRMILAAAALSLFLPGAAFAQGHGRGHQDGGQGQERGHGRGHQAEAHGPPPGHGKNGPNVVQVVPRQKFAENRDRGNFERGRDIRVGRERGRTFSYRGRQYAAVRGAAFVYPRGYSYRAWHPGQVLPRLFIAAPFFIDYGYLGLPPPPPGTRWVRYGPDALLVDVYDDHIVDVIYNAFY